MTSVVSSSAALPVHADEEAAFARVTQGLLSIGAVPVLQHLSYPSSSHNLHTSASKLQQAQPSLASGSEQTITRAVARLHQTCQYTFGNTDALNFEFVDDTANQGKRCVLTITRPNGDARIFTSPSAHQRKYDAKASACTVAIQSGAIDFIVSGGVNPPSAPSTTLPDVQESTALEMDESVKAIEQCCLDWTGGKVKPYWLNINEPRYGRTQGCALRIRLGSHISRVYSVNTIYNSPIEAKKACAEAALSEGVLDYIKTWQSSNAEATPDVTITNTAITLQEFYDVLPQPFPEPITGKTAYDINGPAWLNTAIQSARGGKLVPTFVWTVDPRLGLHGCLLRLERPGEVKSYLVDARFAKRAEAKAAACLLAMSERVGDYIRGVGKAVEDKLSPSTRHYVQETLLTIMVAELRKVRGSGFNPTYEYDMDVDACGASMTVELAPNPSPQQVQKYTVPAEYRNRNDAKLAVVLHAVEQGVIEFLRFQGKPPPPGYVPNYTHQDNQFYNRKRKNWESGDGYNNNGGGLGGEWSNSNNGGQNGYAGDGGNGYWHQNKKQKLGGGAFQQGQGGHGGGSFSFRPPAQGGGGFGHSQGQGAIGTGYQNGHKPGWNGQKQQQYGQKKPHMPGPGQFGVGGTHQMKPGSRYSGGPGPSRPVYQQQQRQPFPAPPPYGGVPVQPPVQNSLVPPSPFAYMGGGPVAGGTQPFQASYFGAAPQPRIQAQATYHTVPQAQVPGPYAVPPMQQGAPGSIPYPSNPVFPVQPQPPVVGVPPHPQVPSHQQQYNPVPLSGQGQFAGYQPFPGQPGRPGYYSTPASMSAPTPPTALSTRPISIPPTVPYYPAPPAAPNAGYTLYQPPLGPTAPQRTSPPHQSPQPTAVPPPPQPPTIPPPPPPPAVAAPPLPPSTLGPSTTPLKTMSNKGPNPQKRPASQTLTPATASANLPQGTSGSSSKLSKVAIHSVAKTNVSALYDYCNQCNKPTPQWYHEIIKGDVSSDSKHKVWVIIGKTRFELPVTFPSLSEGQEKLAKKVVHQLKAASAKGAGS